MIETQLVPIPGGLGGPTMRAVDRGAKPLWLRSSHRNRYHRVLEATGSIFCAEDVRFMQMDAERLHTGALPRAGEPRR